MARGGLARRKVPSAQRTFVDCGFRGSFWHPAQLFLWDLAPAGPLPFLLGPPDSCAQTPELPSAFPVNLKCQTQAFQQVEAPSPPPAAAGSRRHRVLPPSAKNQRDALPKTNSRSGTFHIFLVNSLSLARLVSVLRRD